jgi:hypothetical protein
MAPAEQRLPDLPDRLLLEPSFTADALLSEARGLPDDAWLPHFNTAYYAGDWSGVALRAPGGRNQLYPDLVAHAPYADAPLLDACPSIRSALASLRTEVTSVRLLRLGPGAAIREHRDYQIGFAYGEVRLHIPLETNDDVTFVLAGTPLPMRPGECWYVDVTQPHRVENAGTEPRIHLVVDCVTNAWMRERLGTAARAAFERFVERVAAIPDLGAELWAIEDEPAFVARTVELGRANGFAFPARDVERAIGAGRLRWLAAVDG